MATDTLEPLMDGLEDNIDDLEEALTPLLDASISETASKLPLLDKAKLYVMTTYAIESLLFSYLQLNGVKAKEHPIFIELTRLKQYYEKIKIAETGPMKQDMKLDKDAAGRFIKHALSGNEKYDQERADKQAKEKANAYIKFNEMAEQQEQDRLRQERISKKRKAEEAADLLREEEDESSSDSDDSSAVDTPASKSGSSSAQNTDSASASKESKQRRKKKKDKAIENKNEKMVKKQTPLENQAIRSSAAKEETILPRRGKSNIVPKSPGTAFKALLEGPSPKQASSTKQKNKRKKSKSNT